MLTRPPGGVPDPEPESQPASASDPQPDDRWVSAHVFTGHPLDLVVRALLPEAVAELRRRGLADRFFFLRHWQGGPHLRLRVRLTTPAAEPAVRTTLDAHAAAFFHTRPPSPAMTEGRYQALARQLAAQEPESEPGTLAPHDSLAFHPYRPGCGAAGRRGRVRHLQRTGRRRGAGRVGPGTAGGALLRPADRQPGRGCRAGPAGAGPAGPVRRPAGRPARRRPSSPRGPRAGTGEAAGQAGADPVHQWLAACRNAQRHSALPDRLAGHLTHLACNRLDVRLGQEATLRGLALLAVAELTGAGGPARHDGAAPP